MKSRPIKPTPVLHGEDARRFIDEMNRERTPEEKADARRKYRRAKKVFESVKREDG